MAFSCGARSAFELKEQSYLRNMPSRRQLQGFVMRRCSEERDVREQQPRKLIEPLTKR